ncbi:DinB family protein [Paenibacillus sp. NFR01]|uniref:DinB family protein n=1 Tax=Paenibacillus sp. NFR01 TaxID=1566279 RepID=UPI0008D06BE6|nr:DinB family protein [Paenibacillus sp. NFR01]SEU02388.1 Uncharacterized damage-inducible protein DinB (forms a four-helix bundle) [Paenibacillus sp. NFR01]
MVHAKDVLANQLLAGANDPSWHLPFMQAAQGVTEEQAFWKPAAGLFSIAELTQHLLYWNQTWQTRFREGHVNAVPRIASNDASFIVPAEIAYAELRDRLLEVLLQWHPLLSEERLEAEVDGFPEPARWWEIISNVVTHNAYHIGQIVLVRKLYQALPR